MTWDECVARACEVVPGLRQGALALLPEGLLVGGVGAGSSFEREPLARSAGRCLASSSESTPSFVEHVFISRNELVVIGRGQRYRRLALVVTCGTEANLAFVIAASRAALRELEATIDVRGLEL